MSRRTADGTLIVRERDMSDALMTSIVLKSNVTLMDIVSTRMLGQFGFLAKVSTLSSPGAWVAPNAWERVLFLHDHLQRSRQLCNVLCQLNAEIGQDADSNAARRPGSVSLRLHVCCFSTLGAVCGDTDSQVCSSGVQVFGIFRDQKVSVDVVATSEISISLTLDPRCAAALICQPRTGHGSTYIPKCCSQAKLDAVCLKRLFHGAVRGPQPMRVIRQGMVAVEQLHRAGRSWQSLIH